MYPFVRLIKEMLVHRNAEPLTVTGTHVSHHICWPWDIDLWMELNNGRTLTLYDLGRIPLASRAGLLDALKKKQWGLTMAGACVRYRRRVRMFDRLEMRSRMVGADDRFVYLEQSMWVNGEAANHIVYRAAVTNTKGIVPTVEVFEALGFDETPMELPGWIKAWIDAETLRPWPPEK
jgi:acyl-CoA thioesterase FadM